MTHPNLFQEAFSPFSDAKKSNSDKKAPPRHCTNPECSRFKDQDPHDSSWYREHGKFTTKASGDVQRYRCCECGKTFSTRTFSIDYWTHKHVDYLDLLIPLLSTSGQGNLSRFSGLSYRMIQNRYERLARFFLALHAQLREQIPANEDFVLDGFESLSLSQYFPNNVNILVGSESEFVYGMGFAQLRRKGRMTDAQRQKRTELEEKYGRANTKAVEMSVASLINDLCRWLKSKNSPIKDLRTDEHKAYPRAFDRVEESRNLLNHCQFSSKAARNYTNKLFAVNYVDRQFRKDQANHVRESVQFARCPSAMMIRLTIYQMCHNYLQSRRVKQYRKGIWETRGMRLGLKQEEISSAIKELWGKRIFFNKTSLWEAEKITWKLEWRNSKIREKRWVPKYISV